MIQAPAIRSLARSLTSSILGRAMTRLDELDDRMLMDMGLRRDDLGTLRRIADKPVQASLPEFCRAPATSQTFDFAQSAKGKLL
jgi:uncharacterized protein YjiS (DUF1127 family)